MVKACRVHPRGLGIDAVPDFSQWMDVLYFELFLLTAGAYWYECQAVGRELLEQRVTMDTLTALGHNVKIHNPSRHPMDRSNFQDYAVQRMTQVKRRSLMRYRCLTIALALRHIGFAKQIVDMVVAFLLPSSRPSTMMFTCKSCQLQPVNILGLVEHMHDCHP